MKIFFTVKNGHDLKRLNGPEKKKCHTCIVHDQKWPHWKLMGNTQTIFLEGLDMTYVFSVKIFIF